VTIDDVLRAASGRTADNSCLGYACTDDDVGAWVSAAHNWHKYAKFLGGMVTYKWGQDARTWPPAAIDAAYRLRWVQDHLSEIEGSWFDVAGVAATRRITWAMALQRELRIVARVWRQLLRDAGAKPPDPENMEQTTAPQTEHQTPQLPGLGTILPILVGGLVLLLALRR